jgi:hypothetical protein
VPVTSLQDLFGCFQAINALVGYLELHAEFWDAVLVNRLGRFQVQHFALIFFEVVKNPLCLRQKDNFFLEGLWFICNVRLAWVVQLFAKKSTIYSKINAEVFKLLQVGCPIVLVILPQYL